MAADAVINVRVKGQEKLQKLQQSVERTSRSVDKLNKTELFSKTPLSLGRTNDLLQKAQENVNKTVVGSKRQQVAIRQVVRLKQEQLNQEKAINRELVKQQVTQSKLGKLISRAPGGKGLVEGAGRLAGRLGGSRGAGRLGQVLPGAAIGAAFPLITGAGVEGAVGGGLGGLAGGLIAGPMGAFAGSLIGQVIGERIGEARKLTEEARKYKQITQEIEVIETRVLGFQREAVKARRAGNELLAIEKERRAGNAKIALELFKKQTDLDLDERNKTKEGKRLIEMMKKRLFLESRREVIANNELTLLQKKDAILNKEIQKNTFLSELQQRRVQREQALLDGRTKIESEAISAALKQNDLELQRAKNKKDIVRQFDLEVRRAELLYKQTILQVQQEVQRTRLAEIREAIELKRLQIDVVKTREAGKDTRLQEQAVKLQREALGLATLNVQAAQQAAVFQRQGAEAVRLAAIAQARYNLKQAQGANAANGIRPFAEGGFVTRPTNALIGEGGESEYVIPSSKMSTAMQRYSAGVRGEAVTAGAVTAGSTSTANYSSQQNAYYGSGGGTSVNVTTGPVIRMNNRDYVTMTDMQRGMAAAANAGQANMMRQLGRSYAARRSMGL